MNGTMPESNAPKESGRHLSTAIPSGLITLDFVCRPGGNCRKLLAGFHLGDDPAGLAIRLNESELLAFGRFQQRALTVGAGLPIHDAIKTTAGRNAWADAVAAAVKAGQTIDLENCSGYSMRGGEK